MIWIGQHAMEWAAIGPKRWIEAYIRPHESPGISSPRVIYVNELQPTLETMKNYRGPAQENPHYRRPDVHLMGLDKKKSN